MRTKKSYTGLCWSWYDRMRAVARGAPGTNEPCAEAFMRWLGANHPNVADYVHQHTNLMPFVDAWLETQ